MSIYDNKLFSKAGQLERLANVRDTLVYAVTGKGVVANTPSATTNKVLSTAASNPFVTALGGAVAVAPKAAITAAGAGFNALPTSGKVATVLATPVIIGAVASNPAIVKDVASAPRELSEFGADASSFLANPSKESFGNLIENSPIISSGLAIAGVAAVSPAIVSAVSQARQSEAIRDLAESLPASISSLPATPASGNFLPPAVPITPATTVIGRAASTGVARRKKQKLKAPTLNIRINNRNSFIEAY